MNFEYNERACTVVKDFYTKKVNECINEIGSVSKEKELEKDPFIVKALGDYIRRKENEVVEYNKKIKEMDDTLSQNRT